MSLRNFFYLSFAFLLLFGGCGLTEGVVQKEPKSFIWFTGNTKGAVAYVDDLEPIMLDDLNSSTDGESVNNSAKKGEVHYEISPGKHRIIVKKSGEEVVNRIVLLGNGITKEIKIP